MIKNKEEKKEEVVLTRYEKRRTAKFERMDKTTLFNKMFKVKQPSKVTPEQYSKSQKAKNILKLMRVLKATKDLEARDSLQNRIAKLIKKYGYDKI